MDNSYQVHEQQMLKLMRASGDPIVESLANTYALCNTREKLVLVLSFSQYFDGYRDKAREVLEARN